MFVNTYVCLCIFVCACTYMYIYIKYMGVFIYTYLHVLKLVNLTNSVFFFYTVIGLYFLTIVKRDG